MKNSVRGSLHALHRAYLEALPEGECQDARKPRGEISDRIFPHPECVLCRRTHRNAGKASTGLLVLAGRAGRDVNPIAVPAGAAGSSQNDRRMEIITGF